MILALKSKKVSWVLLNLLLSLSNSVTFCVELVETDDHIITKIAEGVYAIRYKRAARIGALSGNTTVIIGDREALVIDSCLLPSIARSDIALLISIKHGESWLQSDIIAPLRNSVQKSFPV